MTRQGDGSEAFRRLTAKITQAAGIACDAYKERCLRRRIAVRMRAQRVHTFDDYAAVLDREPCEYQRLVDALTINVTKFYRNPETWAALGEECLPDLWRHREGLLRCWSAGCASGEEAYTIAITLTEVGRNAGTSAPLAGVRIDATDLDPQALAQARAARYAASSLSEMPAEIRARYLGPGDVVAVPSALREAVRFRSHDLTQDPPPNAPYDLIVCRNVIIYFDRPMQERLFTQFAEALRPGGFLVLGKVETLLGRTRERFASANARERIYRRM